MGVGAIDQRIRLIQHATTSDFFVFPSQIHTTCVAKDTDRHGLHGPRTFQIDYKIDSRLKEFFQIPSDADPPARGDHDFEALEKHLAWRLIAARRPLQICSEIGVDEDLNMGAGYR